MVFAAGVTAGIDRALVSPLRGGEAAVALQPQIAAPKPPFDSGTPETALSRRSITNITAREHMARRVAAKLGNVLPSAGGN